MKKYHKIQSVFKRDKQTKKFTDEYSLAEFELLKDIQWCFTEKLDGTNIRIGYESEKEVLDDTFEEGEGTITYKYKLKRLIGGRTDKAQIPAHLYAVLEELFPADCANVLSVFDEPSDENFSLTFYGEGVGKKIQKNGQSYLDDGGAEADFILFDIRVGHTWLTRQAIEEIAEKLNLRIAPIIGYGTLEDAIEMCKTGFESITRNDKLVEPEGLVCRPTHELLDRRGNRIITKVKLCDFR